MNCPKCNQHGAEECADEVDIGVGIQKHVWGCECPACGQLAIHSCCGKWEFQGHATHCQNYFRCPACEGDVTEPHTANCNYAPGN